MGKKGHSDIVYKKSKKIGTKGSNSCKAKF